MPQIFDTPIFSSDQSVDRVLNAGLPVVLVFNDGPALSGLDAELKSLAQQEAGRLLVVQLALKDSPEAARRFGISAVPAVVTVKDGKAASQAERITVDDLRAHARYLLGRGPRPAAPSTPSAARTPPQSAGDNGQAGTDRPVTVTDATFDQEVLRSSVPVVVDFWAPWCGPCRMVAPTLDKLAREWSGRVKIAKVNVDENPRVAERYRISGIPTMMVVSGGRIVDQWAGALPEGPLRTRLATHIS